jgi:hypothetical protein
MIGSASAEYRMWPQRQPPDMCCMVFAPLMFLSIWPGQQMQQAACRSPFEKSQILPDRDVTPGAKEG